MDQLGILGVFCGAASLSGILLSFYFFFGKNGKSTSGRLLGLLFLAISMRVAKSVWHYVLYDYAKLGVTQGFVALALIGPALYLYLISSTRKTLRPLVYLHFTGPLLALIIGVIEPMSFRFLYQYGTAYLILYVILGAIVHLRWTYDTEANKKFNVLIIGGVGLIAGALVFQTLFGGPVNYAYGAAFASLIIYLMIFQAMTKGLVLVAPTQHTIANEVIDKVKQAIEEQMIFLEAGISLSAFSQQQDIPAYLVTRAVNQAYGKSFPETINHFRIEEVKRRLANGDSKAMKIEGIATEAGFSTVSAFYTAFKKETGATPTQFQKSLK